VIDAASHKVIALFAMLHRTIRLPMNIEHQEAAASAEPLHNLKAGDGKASEEQTTVNQQRARQGTTASKTAATLAAATTSTKHKTPKKQNSTPFPR
jgi:hypothetical protein